MAKKKKEPPRNLSLKDRLAGHWEAGKWEAFVALYLRDREASDKTAWADRLPEGLYRALTRALFDHKDPAAALGLAERLRAEGGIYGDCGQVALDFLVRRLRPQAPLSNLEADEEELPAPYRALRRRLRETGRPARGRQPKQPAPASLELALLAKLGERFQALARARNLRPYTSFQQTASELARLTARDPAGGTFRALAVLAGLLRDLGGPRRDGGELREPEELLDRRDLRTLGPETSHPAAAGLVNFFLAQGEAKFGRQWAEAARTAIFKLAPPAGADPALVAALGRLLASRHPLIPSFVLAAYQRYPGWSEPERYGLIHSVLAGVQRSGPWALDRVGAPAVGELFREMTRLGRIWRPQAPWTRAAAELFENALLSEGESFFRAAGGPDLPFHSLTPLSLSWLSLRSPEAAALIQAAWRDRPRLPLSETEAGVLAGILTGQGAGEAAAERLRPLLSPDGFRTLLGAWFLARTEREAELISEAAPAAPGLEGLLAAELPADHPGTAFLRFQESGTDADFQDLLEALNRPLVQGSGLAGSLFLALVSRPGTDLNQLMEFFASVREELEEDARWRSLAEAVARIKDGSRRRELASRLAVSLKRKRGRGRWEEEGEREARAWFEALALGKPLPKTDRGEDMHERMRRAFEGVGQDEFANFQRDLARLMERSRKRR